MVTYVSKTGPQEAQRVFKQVVDRGIRYIVASQWLESGARTVRCGLAFKTQEDRRSEKRG
jgi:hypothetical protein